MHPSRGTAAHRAHSCGTIGCRVLPRGWRQELGYWTFIRVPRVICARAGRHAFKSVCTHTCIRCSGSCYLRRTGPRSRSIMYQPQMCISPADCRTMIDQCDTRGLMGCTITRVHTGEGRESGLAICPLVFSSPPPALPVIVKYTLIHIPYRGRWWSKMRVLLDRECVTTARILGLTELYTFVVEISKTTDVTEDWKLHKNAERFMWLYV